MAINLLVNSEYYRTSERQLQTEEDVLIFIKEFLRENVDGTDEQFEIMFADIEKERNHEIRFDTSESQYTRHGNTGNRIAYGAFRHSALEHSVQTVWTYTFEIIKTGEDTLYLGADSWGWLQEADLKERVTTHLE